MKPAFFMVPGGRGSCTVERTNKLTSSFREAVGATQKAIEAIDNLKKPRSHHFSKGGRRTWERQAQLLKALFNIDGDADNPLGKDNPNANGVQRNFQNMLDGLNYKKSDLKDKYWLFCGDDWLHWRPATAMAEIGPHVPQRNVGQLYNNEVRFLARVYTPEKQLKMYIQLPDAPTTHPMCQPLNSACTLRTVGATTFCDIAFRHNSLATTKAKIRPGDMLGDPLMTLAHLWIHEWAHLINGFADQPSLDGNGVPIPGNANGWQRGVNLARWAPERASVAPDPYALFATAVYFDNFGWGNGTAVE
ncbi:MAG: hypothetical protein Q9221_007675 [Calogaya cf. arnoldii]